MSGAGANANLAFPTSYLARSTPRHHPAHLLNGMERRQVEDSLGFYYVEGTYCQTTKIPILETLGCHITQSKTNSAFRGWAWQQSQWHVLRMCPVWTPGGSPVQLHPGQELLPLLGSTSVPSGHLTAPCIPSLCWPWTTMVTPWSHPS